MVIKERKVEDIESAQQAVKDITDYIKDRDTTFPPFGRVLKDETIGTAATTMYHGLGYKYSGFIIVRCNVATVFYEDSNSNKGETLILISATTEAVVDIWVF